LEPLLRLVLSRGFGLRNYWSTIEPQGEVSIAHVQ
jgi:hypothetical protein